MHARPRGRSWPRPLRAALLLGLLAGCAAPGTPRAGASPSPAPVDTTYNARAGSNRAAAEASMAVARGLYADGGAYWEVYVRTTPQDPSPPRNPLDPAQVAAQGRQVKSVEVVMATESGLAIQSYRKGGHAHEQALMTTASRLLQDSFPGALAIEIRIYFGESHEHAVATWSDGALDYRVLDSL